MQVSIHVKCENKFIELKFYTAKHFNKHTVGLAINVKKGIVMALELCCSDFRSKSRFRFLVRRLLKLS